MPSPFLKAEDIFAIQVHDHAVLTERRFVSLNELGVL